jgi:hypothetical protein
MPALTVASQFAVASGVVFVVTLSACGQGEPRFPLREPLRRDTDLAPFKAPCRADAEGHQLCAPEEYVSPLVWDGADNMVFRPLAETFAVEASTEAVNVNSFDEVPDSAWFTGRLGARPFGIEELSHGACKPEQLLHPETVAEGGWLIDKGKANGASAGFRVTIAGQGKYMFKSDDPVPERPSAASVIGAAAYHAAGFFTSCEQVVYFKPSLLKLKPGLRSAANFATQKPLDEAALAAIVSKLARRGELVRMQASAWLPGKPLGPFRYEGTRDDDANDVIPHQHRRELRGGRLLAAWLDHFDAREQNTMDSWQSDGNAADSPGRVIHYYLDTSDCLGSEWAWDGISRRLGRSYVFDWRDVSADFVTFGLRRRPWELVQRTPGRERFGYFEYEHFVPQDWKNEYPNPAFSRMTERDGAWMARILARFTPEMVSALAALGQFSDPGNTAHIARILEGRLELILRRYLTRLSPISDLRVAGQQLCGVDLARRRGLQPARDYRYSASSEPGASLRVEAGEGGALCVTLPRSAAPANLADAAPERYLQVRIQSSAARGPLVAHLYDLGRRGFRLVGIERPD